MESSAISPMDPNQGRISTDYSREAELDRLVSAGPSGRKEKQSFREEKLHIIQNEVCFVFFAFLFSPLSANLEYT